jgi:hypothetical protein
MQKTRPPRGSGDIFWQVVASLLAPSLTIDTNPMGRFLRENWIWIAGPILVILAGVAALLIMDGDDGNQVFDNYDIL